MKISRNLTQSDLIETLKELSQRILALEESQKPSTPTKKAKPDKE